VRRVGSISGLRVIVCSIAAEIIFTSVRLLKKADRQLAILILSLNELNRPQLSNCGSRKHSQIYIAPCTLLIHPLSYMGLTDYDSISHAEARSRYILSNAATMLHPDGMEVYLKPAGEDNEGRKFAEFPAHDNNTTTAAEGDHERRCTVLASNNNLTVVVRCQAPFTMYHASALLVQVDQRPPLPSGCKQWQGGSYSGLEHTNNRRKTSIPLPKSYIGLYSSAENTTYRSG